MTKSTHVIIMLIIGIFLSVTQVAFAQDGIIALPTDSVNISETKTLDVGIVCATVDCAAIDIMIQYDPAIIKVNSAEAGGFWTQTGNTVFPVANTINEAAGTIRFALVTINSGNPGVTGSGSALRLNVTGLVEGSSGLTATNLQLGSLAGAAVSSMPANGSIAVIDNTATAMRMESDATTYNVGDTLTVRVIANNLTDAYGLALDCDVNKTILAGQSVALGTIFDSSNNLPINNSHKDDNSWDFGGTQRNPAPVMTGSGLAFTLTFQAVAEGVAQIVCAPKAADSTVSPIAIEFSGISITVGSTTTPPKDTDGDGFTDDVDACPLQGDLGNGVDATGCPIPVNLDPDGDGVPIPTDICPTEGDLGNGVDADGCPIPVVDLDPDGDGVPIPTDICPTEGDLGNGVDADGCPIPVVNTGRIVSLITLVPVSTTVRVVNTVDSSEITVNIATDGIVIIPDLAPGTYDVYASAPQHLTALAGGVAVVADQDANLGPVTLLNGDVNNDGAIDLDDMSVVAFSYNLTIPPTPVEYDLVKDNLIDIFDITVIALNFGKPSPIPWLTQ